MAFLQYHMGRAVVVRIDQEAVHPPNLTVGGVHVIAPAGHGLADRDNRVGDGPQPVRHPHRDSHTGDGTADAQAADVAVSLDRLRRAIAAQVAVVLHDLNIRGRVKPAELGEGAPQPGRAIHRFGHLDRHKPAFLRPVLRLYGQVRDRASGWSKMIRITSPQKPSEQYAWAPIVNSVSAATAAAASRWR